MRACLGTQIFRQNVPRKRVNSNFATKMWLVIFRDKKSLVPQKEALVHQKEALAPQKEALVPQKAALVPQEEGTKKRQSISRKIFQACASEPSSQVPSHSDTLFVSDSTESKRNKRIGSKQEM